MQLLVPLNSLQVYESHERLGDAFFRASGSDWGVQGGAFDLLLRVKSEGARSLVEVDLAGVVRLECDRCLEPFDCPMEFSGCLEVHRESRRGVEMDGDAWRVPLDQEQLDVAPYVLESVYLSLPMRRYHGVRGTLASDCDASMCSYIASGETLGLRSGGESLGILMEKMNALREGGETD